MNKLEKVQALDPDVLQTFLSTHKSVSISDELQAYIMRLSSVPEIIFHCGATLSRVVDEMRKRFPDLTFAMARDIYYDAMNFFHQDSSVSAEAWDNYYADQMEKLARLNIKMGKNDSARRCFECAHDYRILAAERIKPEEWKVPTFIITNKVTPKDLGYEKKSILEIQRKDEDGYYLRLINSLEIPDKEKKRLMKDANVTDVEYEEVNDGSGTE